MLNALSNWRSWLPWVFLAVVVAVGYQWQKGVHEDSKAARGAEAARVADVRESFLSRTGASFDWMEDAGCKDFATPLSQVQRAIGSERPWAFVLMVQDIVVVGDRPQVRATAWPGHSCWSTTAMRFHLWITEDQENALASVGYRAQLAAVDVQGTEPQELVGVDGTSTVIIVAGTLVDFAEWD